MGIGEVSAGNLFLKGGPIMWPIVLCSIFVVAFVVEKFLYFSSIKTDTVRLRDTIFALLKSDRLREAIELCDTNPSPVARILKAGILAYGRPRENILAAIEDVSVIEVPKLEQRLPALATVSHVATLLGLLGTVLGLCNSFYAIEQRANSLSPLTPNIVAGGIWEALLTTVAGLAVAIGAFLAYQYLSSRVEAIIRDMERSATDIATLLSQLAENQPLADHNQQNES